MNMNTTRVRVRSAGSARTRVAGGVDVAVGRHGRAGCGIRESVAGGFTLMELLVVIGVIALVAAIAIPGIMSILSAGTDSQAYNLMTGELVGARSVAIRNSNYVGVHVQLADASTASGNPELEGVCYAALVEYDRTNRYFVCNLDFLPRRMPGSMAFGELSGTFVTAAGTFQNLGSTDDFTSFTIVFSPAGAVAKLVEGRNVTFNAADRLFVPSAATPRRLWDPNVANKGGAGETGMTAVTLFDYKQFAVRDAAARVTYLNDYGQFIPVNVHTGQLYPRE